MPRRGSRLMFKPSSILVAFSSMPNLVRLENNFLRQSRPSFTCCEIGATLPKRRLLSIDARICSVQIPEWRWITELGVAAAAITSWLSWPVYPALSRIHYFCRGTDRRITEQPCWLTDRPGRWRSMWQTTSCPLFLGRVGPPLPSGPQPCEQTSKRHLSPQTSRISCPSYLSFSTGRPCFKGRRLV